MARALPIAGGLALALTAMVAPSALAATEPSQLDLAAMPAVKLTVTGTGWQRVRQPALVAAGLDPAVDPRALRLFADGVEQGLSVTGNGDSVFDDEESIEFFGVGRDTLWTATRTYWLIVGAAGKPIPEVAYLAGDPPPPSFPTAAVRRDRTIYFAPLKNGDASNFFGDQVTTTGAIETVALMHLDPSQTAALQLVLQGVTAGTHQVAIALNGQPVGGCSFAGQELHTCAVSPVVPVEGTNQIQLVAEGDAPDVSLVASAEVEYGHLFLADGDALKLAAPPLTQLTIAGFSRPDARVIDVTDPDSPVELATSPSASGSTYAVTVNTPGGTFPSTLYAFSSAAIVTPGVTSNHPSTWTEPRNGELVILSNALFLDALAPLVAQRRQQGWSVQLIDLQDVYDEFGAGDKTVFAVRDFLQAIHSRWTQPPRFVLLVGDASFDSRNFLGKGDFDFAPTKLIDTQQMETASDDWFVDWNDDGLPDVAIGRLAVRTPAEAATVVQKTVGYAGADARRPLHRRSRRTRAAVRRGQRGERRLGRRPAADDELLPRSADLDGSQPAPAARQWPVPGQLHGTRFRVSVGRPVDDGGRRRADQPVAFDLRGDELSERVLSRRFHRESGRDAHQGTGRGRRRGVGLVDADVVRSARNVESRVRETAHAHVTGRGGRDGQAGHHRHRRAADLDPVRRSHPVRHADAPASVRRRCPRRNRRRVRRRGAARCTRGG
jgi:hypothetical protein